MREVPAVQKNDAANMAFDDFKPELVVVLLLPTLHHQRGWIDHYAVVPPSEQLDKASRLLNIRQHDVRLVRGTILVGA